MTVTAYIAELQRELGEIADEAEKGTPERIVLQRLLGFASSIRTQAAASLVDANKDARKQA